LAHQEEQNKYNETSNANQMMYIAA